MNESEEPLVWRSALGAERIQIGQLSDGGVGIRNGDDPGGEVLRYTRQEWAAFVGGVRKGEFDAFGRTE